VELKRIGPISAAKISGALYAILGLFFGVFVSLFSLLGLTAASQAQPGGEFLGLLFGVGAVILLPIIYGLLGFVSSLIMALIYNGLAKVCGGVVLELVPNESNQAA